jgi:hypothetical protein
LGSLKDRAGNSARFERLPRRSGPALVLAIFLPRGISEIQNSCYDVANDSIDRALVLATAGGADASRRKINTVKVCSSRLRVPHAEVFRRLKPAKTPAQEVRRERHFAFGRCAQLSA